MIIAESRIPGLAITDHRFDVPLDYPQPADRRMGNIRIWVTNEFEHNGLRESGSHLLGRMLDMLHGEV